VPRSLTAPLLAAHGTPVGQIGLVAALYPAVWSLAQIPVGHWSDTAGRKPLIVGGMLDRVAAAINRIVADARP